MYNADNTYIFDALHGRSNVSPGISVEVVQKQHQRTGQLTAGVVSRLLTNSAYHPRGIKVTIGATKTPINRDVAELGLSSVSSRRYNQPKHEEPLTFPWLQSVSVSYSVLHPLLTKRRNKDVLDIVGFAIMARYGDFSSVLAQLSSVGFFLRCPPYVAEF